MPPKTGNKWDDWWTKTKFNLLLWLDRIDTKYQFKNKKVSAIFGRVESRGEAMIADYLTENFIRFEYELRIKVNGHYPIPDFYLPDAGVFIEYWGLADANGEMGDKYRRDMAKKQKWYKDNRIGYISVMPQDRKNIEQVLEQGFYQLTGKNLKDFQKGGRYYQQKEEEVVRLARVSGNYQHPKQFFYISPRAKRKESVMKTTFKWLIGAPVALVLIVVIASAAGMNWAPDFLKDRIQIINGTIKKGTSSDYIITQARKELQEKLNFVKKKSVDVALKEADFKALKERRDKAIADLADQDSALIKGDQWIKAHSPGQFLVINGIQYSYKTVKADANIRAKNCRAARENIARYNTSLKNIGNSINLAKENINKALAYIRRERGELAAKEAILDGQNAALAAKSVSDSLDRGELSSEKFKNSKYLPELKERIIRNDAELSFNSKHEASTSLIPYTDKDSGPDSAYKKYLQEFVTPKPAPRNSSVPIEKLPDNPEKKAS